MCRRRFNTINSYSGHGVLKKFEPCQPLFRHPPLPALLPISCKISTIYPASSGRCLRFIRLGTIILTQQDNHSPFKHLVMGNILYILAVILIIGWLLGKFAFGVTSSFIHVLLVIAVVLFLIKLLGGRTSV